jgi:hypothetical protein
VNVHVDILEAQVLELASSVKPLEN